MVSWALGIQLPERGVKPISISISITSGISYSATGGGVKAYQRAAARSAASV